MQTIKTAGNSLIIWEIKFTGDIKRDMYYDLPKELRNKPENILGKLSELSEEECSMFVEKDTQYGNYRDYRGLKNNDEVIHPYYDYKHAKWSLISLLQSNGIDTSKEKELLIILVI